jgi:hypothetical protein
LKDWVHQEEASITQYASEVRERAVRMVFENEGERASAWFTELAGGLPPFLPTELTGMEA